MINREEDKASSKAVVNKSWHLESHSWQRAFGLLKAVAAIILLSMILLTVVDVVARYVYNLPIDGAYELIEIMLALTIFSALPITTYSKQHIVVELIEPFKHPQLLSVQKLFIGLLSCTILLAVAYAVGMHAIKIAKHGQLSNSLDIPMYLIASYAAFSLVLSAWIVMQALLCRNKKISAATEAQND